MCASASAINIYDASSSQGPPRLQSCFSANNVLSLDFSTDSGQLTLSRRDHATILFHSLTKTNIEPTRLPESIRQAQCVRFFGAQARFIAGYLDAFENGENAPSENSPSPTTALKEAIFFWDTKEKRFHAPFELSRLLQALGTEKIRHLQFSVDERFLTVATESDRINCLNTQLGSLTQCVIPTPSTHSSSVKQRSEVSVLELSKTKLVAGTIDGTLHVFDLNATVHSSNTTVHSASTNITRQTPMKSFWNIHASPVQAIAFNHGKKELIVSVGMDRRIAVFDPTKGSPVRLIEAASPLTTVSFLKNGVDVVVGGCLGTLTAYDMRSKNILWSFAANPDLENASATKRHNDSSNVETLKILKFYRMKEGSSDAPFSASSKSSRALNSLKKQLIPTTPKSASLSATTTALEGRVDVVGGSGKQLAPASNYPSMFSPISTRHTSILKPQPSPFDLAIPSNASSSNRNCNSTESSRLDKFELQSHAALKSPESSPSTRKSVNFQPLVNQIPEERVDAPPRTSKNFSTPPLRLDKSAESLTALETVDAVASKDPAVPTDTNVPILTLPTNAASNVCFLHLF